MSIWASKNATARRRSSSNISAFGVGYGEVRPLQTAEERRFTIGVIIAGTTSAVYIVGGFAQMVTEGEIHPAPDAQQGFSL